MLESLFKGVTGKGLQDRCFPVKFAIFTEQLRLLLLETSIHGNTKYFGGGAVYVGVVGIMHGGAHFRGFRAFGKLKY